MPVALASLDALIHERRLWPAAGQATGRPGESTGHAALDAALPGGGWPAASLLELLLPMDGVGELGVLMPTLVRLSRQGRGLAMVAPPYLPYAPALAAAGVDLSRLLVLRVQGREALWATEQALRSGACGAVLCWPNGADDRALRRLSVAAEQGDALGFAFRPLRALQQPSPAALRIELMPDSRVRVHKCRGGAVPSMPVDLKAMSPAMRPALHAVH